MRTHYQNLKVSENAPSEVIKAAFRALSQVHHPDKNPDNPDSGRIMQILNSAYDVLGDENKRRDYDAFLAAERAKHRITPEENEPSIPPRVPSEQPKPKTAPQEKPKYHEPAEEEKASVRAYHGGKSFINWSTGLQILGVLFLILLFGKAFLTKDSKTGVSLIYNAYGTKALYPRIAKLFPDTYHYVGSFHGNHAYLAPDYGDGYFVKGCTTTLWVARESPDLLLRNKRTGRFMVLEASEIKSASKPIKDLDFDIEADNKVASVLWQRCIAHEMFAEDLKMGRPETGENFVFAFDHRDQGNILETYVGTTLRTEGEIEYCCLLSVNKDRSYLSVNPSGMTATHIQTDLDGNAIGNETKRSIQPGDVEYAVLQFYRDTPMESLRQRLLPETTATPGARGL